MLWYYRKGSTAFSPWDSTVYHANRELRRKFFFTERHTKVCKQNFQNSEWTLQFSFEHKYCCQNCTWFRSFMTCAMETTELSWVVWFIRILLHFSEMHYFSESTCLWNKGESNLLTLNSHRYWFHLCFFLQLLDPQLDQRSLKVTLSR